MNRPHSMTAFGRGEAGSERTWTVELRSVNHRFCDVKVKMPREYALLEDRVKKEITTLFNRGHIKVLVSVNNNRGAKEQARVNLDLARQYLNCLAELQNTFDLEGKPTLAMVAALPDVISEEVVEENLDAVWTEIREALAQATAACLAMRADEGRILKNELLTRLQGFEATVTGIAGAIPGLVAKRETTLKERLAALLQGVELDPLRLAQEVAIMADRYDVTEELVRLASHIQQFRSFMELNEPVGRRLDFLLQEFLREINTLGSKINDTEVTHKIVDLKNEVEKIREQVQNLE
jgi:uncharacterized protein (TIGR00255 family)